MPDRKSLVSTLWLASSLALLAWVMFPPLRTSGVVSVSFQHECLRVDFAVSPGQPTVCFSRTTTTDRVQQVKAISTEEDEEQERFDALDEPRTSFLISASFRKMPDRNSIARRSILSVYPLRC
jgi:hypothetical protein